MMAHSIGTPLFWTAFLVVVTALLLVDLGLFHRKAHTVGMRESMVWSIVWVVLSIGFGLWIYNSYGSRTGLEFFTGYLIEKALSVDNIFVFILIFSYFKVPPKLHHRVLFWGILAALIMRAIFILAGAALIEAFHWILYVFGAFLVFTGIKIMRHGETEVEPEHNPVVRLFNRFIPMSNDYASEGFVLNRDGRWLATPLALVLVTVETTDLVFATDSIPAIFGVTKDPFIIYTSNVCAILGLRSLYFLLAAMVGRFTYLGTGLGIVLLFIGAKMLVGAVYEIPIGVSLGVVASILTGSVVLSLLRPSKDVAISSKHAPRLVRCDTEDEKPEVN